MQFRSPPPLPKTRKLIRLPLLTSHPSISAQKGWVLRPFCAQLFLALFLFAGIALRGCGALQPVFAQSAQDSKPDAFRPELRKIA
jgi:hypothetical protein